MPLFQTTFLVNKTLDIACFAHQLCQAANLFKSDVTIVNITRDRSAQLCHSLGIMQATLVTGDICQIITKGIDAEPACSIIRAVIAMYHTVIDSAIRHQFNHALSEQLPQLAPPIDLVWSYYRATTKLTKCQCLEKLAQLIYPTDAKTLVNQLLKREQLSSTCITPGIALPHTLFADIEQVNIAVIRHVRPIFWESQIGEVQLVIAVVLPHYPTKAQLLAVTNLTRNLLAGQFAKRLLATRATIELQALLIHSMSRLFG